MNTQSLTRALLRLLLLGAALTILAACQPLDLPPAAGAESPAAVAGQAPDAESGETDLPAVDVAALDPDAPLPLDPAVRLGQLDNGLIYIIRRNTEPLNRAELRLVINAGSLQEDEDQLGLAHLLEHMLFNGTARFPEQALIDFMEGIGMGFGPDVNAYTSFDETVYMLRVPTDDDEVFGTALDILEDWAGYATLDPAEIDAERGVVVEEWRLRDQNSNGRIREQLLPAILGDSQYVDRLPIGDMDVIRNAPADAVQRFYTTWYRPDLMAVIAVGDFDVDEVEQQIAARFSSLENPSDEVDRPSFVVPSHDGTVYKVILDPEFTADVVQIYVKQLADVTTTLADYRASLAAGLFYQMLNNRLDEVSRQGDAPFVYAFAGDDNFVRPLDTSIFGAQMKSGRIAEGLDALMVEVERARRHGFTATELARAKVDFLNSYELAYNDRENNDSANFVDEYTDYFLVGTTIPGIEAEFAIAQELIPALTLDEINATAEVLAAVDNRSVVMIAPEKEGTNPPDEAALAAIVEGVAAKEIAPYEDAVNTAPLLAEIPAPVAVISTTVIPELGVTTIVLENGVTVIMKPTQFREEEVLFSASSPGGSSLVPDEDVAEAEAISEIIDQSGVADHTLNDLIRLLAGKSVSATPYIGELYEGFSGAAEPDDLETLFQLVHLYATQPRVDEDAVAVYQDQWRTWLENRQLSPISGLQDALLDALYGDSIRRNITPLDEIDNLDMVRAQAIYNDRFADFSDSVFTFVGNFDTAQVTELAQRYLGTLPGIDRGEEWVDVAPAPPTGIIETNVFRGQEEQSIVELIFTGEYEPTDNDWERRLALETVLDILIREDLREDRAGIYSPFVSMDTSYEPFPLFESEIGFGADPNRVGELVDAVFAIVEDLQTNGPSAANLEKAKEQQRRMLEEDLEDNGFWLGELESYGLDPEGDPLDILTYADLIDQLTVEEIQQAAQELLPLDRYVLVVLYPESYEGQVE